MVQPDSFSRSARSVSEGMSERDAMYFKWWAEFLPAFNEAHPDWTNSRSPQPSNWISFPSGRGGVNYCLAFSWPTGATEYSLRADLSLRDNESAYRTLEAQRADLDNDCTLELHWEPRENAKTSRIAVYLEPVNP